MTQKVVTNDEATADDWVKTFFWLLSLALKVMQQISEVFLFKM
jgi:hypothetical protein